MSRGIGKIQRKILAIARDGEYRDDYTLAALAHGLRPHLSAMPPTPSQLTSTRRALAGLAERGLAFRVGRRWTTERKRVLADTIRNGHYLRSVPTRPVHWFEHDGAVVVFGVPANRNFSQWLLGKPNAVAELARLWAPDGHRPNLLTEALSAAIASLRKAAPGYEALVSYADPNMGHEGHVYRAASWTALGAADESRWYHRNGTPIARRRLRGLRKADLGAHGIVEEARPAKLRFVRGLTRAARRIIAERAAAVPHKRP